MTGNERELRPVTNQSNQGTGNRTAKPRYLSSLRIAREVREVRPYKDGGEASLLRFPTAPALIHSELDDSKRRDE